MKQLKFALFFFTVICFKNTIYSQNPIPIVLEEYHVMPCDLDSSVLTKAKYREIRMDSICVCNTELESLLSKITINSPDKFQWSFYVTLVKQDSLIYFEIVGDISNEEVFKARSIIHYSLIGYTSINNKDVFFRSTSPLIDNKEFSPLIEMTGKQSVIKKELNVYNIDIKLENPMWLYYYDGISIKLKKDVNTESFGVD